MSLTCFTAKSKLAVYLWTRKLQEKLNADGTPITVVSLDPGQVWTGTSDQSPFQTAFSKEIVHAR